LAKAIEKKFGIKPEVIQSGGGVFDITVDGIKIFSKKEQGRFPTPEEILKAIKNMNSR
jgi:selT/selW/selH-like putative selenoprotein